MKIRHKGGPVRRVIGEYEWSAANGFVCEVLDGYLAASLLTEPSGEFSLSRDEPLMHLKGVGPQRAIEFALLGVASLEQLAAMDAGGVKRLADGTSASLRQVERWVQEAREGLQAAHPQHLKAWAGAGEKSTELYTSEEVEEP